MILFAISLFSMTIIFWLMAHSLHMCDVHIVVAHCIYHMDICHVFSIIIFCMLCESAYQSLSCSHLYLKFSIILPREKCIAWLKEGRRLSFPTSFHTIWKNLSYILQLVAMQCCFSVREEFACSFPKNICKYFCASVSEHISILHLSIN